MKGCNVDIKVQPDGSLVISNFRLMIKIQPDGVLSLSSLDPVVLTCACLGKIESEMSLIEATPVLVALGKRIE